MEAHFGQSSNELVSISVFACLLNQRALLVLRQICLLGTKETRCDVLIDCAGEQHGLLLYQTNVGSEPCKIQLTNIDTIQEYYATGLVIPAFFQQIRNCSWMEDP
jgi:hypothetical protein